MPIIHRPAVRSVSAATSVTRCAALGASVPPRVAPFCDECLDWHATAFEDLLRDHSRVVPSTSTCRNTLRCVCHGQCTYVISAVSLEPPTRKLRESRPERLQPVRCGKDFLLNRRRRLFGPSFFTVLKPPQLPRRFFERAESRLSPLLRVNEQQTSSAP